MRRLVVLGMLAAGGAAFARRLRPGRGAEPAAGDDGAVEAPAGPAAAPPEPVAPSTLEEEVAEAVRDDEAAAAQLPAAELPPGWVQVDHVFPAVPPTADDEDDAGPGRPGA